MLCKFVYVYNTSVYIYFVQTLPISIFSIMRIKTQKIETLHDKTNDIGFASYEDSDHSLCCSHEKCLMVKPKLLDLSWSSSVNHGVQRRMISVDNFFVFSRLLFFCFVVAI